MSMLMLGFAGICVGCVAGDPRASVIRSVLPSVVMLTAMAAMVLGGFGLGPVLWLGVLVLAALVTVLDRAEPLMSVHRASAFVLMALLVATAIPAGAAGAVHDEGGHGPSDGLASIAAVSLLLFCAASVAIGGRLLAHGARRHAVEAVAMGAAMATMLPMVQ